MAAKCRTMVVSQGVCLSGGLSVRHSFSKHLFVHLLRNVRLMCLFLFFDLNQWSECNWPKVCRRTLSHTYHLQQAWAYFSLHLQFFSFEVLFTSGLGIVWARARATSNWLRLTCIVLQTCASFSIFLFVSLLGAFRATDYQAFTLANVFCTFSYTSLCCTSNWNVFFDDCVSVLWINICIKVAVTADAKYGQ